MISFKENLNKITVGDQKDVIAMTIAMGFSNTDARKIAQTITELSSDLGSFCNKNTDDIFCKLKSAINGEFEPLKSIGIVINQQRLDQLAIVEGIEFTKNKMDAKTKATLTMKLILQDTAKVRAKNRVSTL